MDNKTLIRLYVRNTGSIIKDEDKDRIWESFYKSDKARTRKYGGSGLAHIAWLPRGTSGSACPSYADAG